MKGLPGFTFTMMGEGVRAREFLPIARQTSILNVTAMQLVPKEVVAAFPRAMLNIHPGFLPTFGGKGFYGERVHKAVIASGVRFTGPTVHFVDENYDTGPIVAQRVIPVSPCDDHKHLAARVLKEVESCPSE